MNYTILQQILSIIIILLSVYYIGYKFVYLRIGKTKTKNNNICDNCSSVCINCPFNNKIQEAKKEIKTQIIIKKNNNNMLNRISIEKILFIDIETVPSYANYDELPERHKKLWDKKSATLIKNTDEIPSNIYNRAGIYAEFGKIICISAGFIQFGEGGKKNLRIKSFAGDDEKQLLSDFLKMLSSLKDYVLCGHNAKEFDFPYIARRIIINGLALPDILDVAGKKPWEVNFLDTMDLWRFGDYKSYTSLELLTAILDIPTPKDDIDGSQVADTYYKEKNLERIVTYCQKDVLSVVQVLLRFMGEKLIEEDNIIIVDK